MSVREALTLRDLTSTPISFVRLDPPVECAACKALHPLFEAAASQLRHIGVWQVNCGKRSKLCDLVASPRADSLPNEPTVAVYDNNSFTRYEGPKSIDGLAEFFKAYVRSSEADIPEPERASSSNDMSPNELLQAGLRDFLSKDRATADVAVRNLELAIERGAVDVDTPPGQRMLTLIGRYRQAFGDIFGVARAHFARAASSRATGPYSQCASLQVATLMASYPESAAHRDRVLADHHESVAKLLTRTEERWEMSLIEDTDPYLFCMMSAFEHSLYYKGNARAVMRNYASLMTMAFPQLVFTAPHLRELHPTAYPACRPDQLRVGIASAFFNHGSSVMQDFEGVLARLPRDIFHLTFIRVNERNRDAPFLRTRAQRGDAVLTVEKEVEDDGGKHESGDVWLHRARADIGALELDVLLYLDLTMSSMAHRLGLSRLARVQAVTHGHPLTSGFGRASMDYYISWAAAEVPTAREHYTERLELLPATSMHQYYEHNFEKHVDGTLVSRIDGQLFGHLTRESFGAIVPADGHWYLCMSKPFKRHPELDAMLAAVLAADPDGRLLLHEVASPYNQRIMHERMRAAGANMSRVHFVPLQPHHRLLALYTLSDVNLDSYPQGGCTTTREVRRSLDRTRSHLRVATLAHVGCVVLYVHVALRRRLQSAGSSSLFRTSTLAPDGAPPTMASWASPISSRRTRPTTCAWRCVWAQIASTARVSKSAYERTCTCSSIAMRPSTSGRHC